MTKLRNAAGGFVIAFVLIVLLANVFNGFKEGYDITEENTVGGDNVMVRLSNTNLMEGINDLTAGVQKTLQVSGITDVLGGIALSATGILQTIGGIITFPVDIFTIIFGTEGVEGHYGSIIPPIITKMLGALVVITVAFILLSAKLGKDV